VSLDCMKLVEGVKSKSNSRPERVGTGGVQSTLRGPRKCPEPLFFALPPPSHGKGQPWVVD
jgi:hypothetical protein